MKSQTEKEVPVWVVTVTLRLIFKWNSKHSNCTLPSVRTLRAETEEAAKLQAVERVKFYREQQYSGDGLKKIEVDWSYAVNISKGNATPLS